MKRQGARGGHDTDNIPVSGPGALFPLLFGSHVLPFTSCATRVFSPAVFPWIPLPALLLSLHYPSYRLPFLLLFPLTFCLVSVYPHLSLVPSLLNPLHFLLFFVSSYPLHHPGLCSTRHSAPQPM